MCVPHLRFATNHIYRHGIIVDRAMILVRHQDGYLVPIYRLTILRTATMQLTAHPATTSVITTRSRTLATLKLTRAPSR